MRPHILHFGNVLLCILFICIISTNGASVIVFVDPDIGTPNGPTVYLTIEKALQHVGQLTVLLVPTSIHIINTTITSPADSVILKTDPSYSELAQITCNNSAGGFQFLSQTSIQISSLQMYGCNKTNATVEIRNVQTVTLDKVDFSQMKQGAISLWNIPTAALSQVTITNCSSDIGNLFIAKTNVTIKSSQFVNNTALGFSEAGAILMSIPDVDVEYGHQYSNNLFIDSCLFENNKAHDTGGAITIRSDRTVQSYAEFKNTTFRNNIVNSEPGGGSSGGAIFMDETKFYVENCRFQSNVASCAGNGLGGGIAAFYSQYSPIFTNVVKNTSFDGADVCHGGGIYYVDQYVHPVDFTGISCTGNDASVGAGLWLEGATGTISNSSFSGNEGDGFYSLFSTLQLVRVTASGNNNGYGIRCNGSVTLYEPSVYGNTNDFSCINCTYLATGNFSSTSLVIDPCQTCTRDKCTVCNGNNTCLGCSGLPWDPSCVSPSASPQPSKTPLLKDKPKNGNSPIGAIIGGVVGGIALLLIGTLVAFIIIKKRRLANKDEEITEHEMNMDSKDTNYGNSNNNNTLSVDPDRYNNIALTEQNKDSQRTVYAHAVYGHQSTGSIYGNSSFARNDSVMDLKKPSAESWRDIKNITVLELLGEGNFGAVYKGMWGSTPVALKKIKDPELSQFFDKEAQLLSNCQHPHIVQYLGLWKDGTDKYIVTEFMLKGSLDHVLYNEQSTITQAQMISLAQNIAAGMEYLSEKGLIHRDLALRNILVTYGGPTGQQYVAKVADFGLARETSSEYYKAEKTCSIPVKWSAPEALEYGKFSTKSDVWSFGVVLWELFSFGKRPYIGLKNEDVIAKLESGYRLPAPSNCPESIVALMNRCWSWKPAERPSFEDISRDLSLLAKQ